jgi:hypothetical protein
MGESSSVVSATGVMGLLTATGGWLTGFGAATGVLGAGA